MGVILLCFLFRFNLEAQLPPPIHQTLPNKSSLFTNLPDKFTIKNSLIEDLFSGPDSGSVKILLSVNNFFEGTITERIQRNENVVTLNIKSSNYDGALLTISKVLNSNKELTYTGRIVSMQYGDVLILKKESDRFFFTKAKQSLVIVE